MVQTALYNKKNVVNHTTTSNLKSTIDMILTEVQQAQMRLGLTVNAKTILAYIDDYNVYDEILSQAELWQSEDLVDMVFDAIQYSQNKQIEALVQLNYMEQYNVALDSYIDLFKKLQNLLTEEQLKALAKKNMNFLLLDQIEEPKLKQKSLPCIQAKHNPNLAKWLSSEQKKVVKATEPLILVQAAAGAGKSTVILERIAHMEFCGVDAKDITVLSFTNAAADNIKAKNNNINSMTIAKMVHTIYEANFKHMLSTLDTVINSIDIRYSLQDDLTKKFKYLIQNLMFGRQNSYIELNNFIEDHYDKAIEILNEINQTTLELEIMICYQKMQELNTPDDLKVKYVIIDETQDNSVFEFIYMLKFINKNNASLMIIGDASQTLYEFRASNPRALNAIEASSVFESYKLTTNYRSNQEILDFANILLSNIDANKYSQIQMRANSLAKPTKASFKEKVKLEYFRHQSRKEFDAQLPVVIKSNMKPYIDEKLQIGEKVAILTFTNRQSFAIQKVIKELYPTKQIVSLMPEKAYNSTIFSKFIKNYWDKVQFVPTKSIIGIIIQMIYEKLEELTGKSRDTMMPIVQPFIEKYLNENRNTIKVWQNQYNNKQITKDNLLDYIKENMLDFEISNNVIRQQLISSRNSDRKKEIMNSNPDIIFSTIHSAKGLEFDNVIVLYNDDSNMSEENKRMYYVALTRAMKSELVIANGKVVSPKVQSDYNMILEKLK